MDKNRQPLLWAHLLLIVLVMFVGWIASLAVFGPIRGIFDQLESFWHKCVPLGLAALTAMAYGMMIFRAKVPAYFGLCELAFGAIGGAVALQHPAALQLDQTVRLAGVLFLISNGLEHARPLLSPIKS